ncbi:WD40 repeat-like protein [Karstenula rhodostoma CBS 690.94]|uniref:ASTRA-associated protein 1 n=1 Tax=Karstenula rhodostoma CBS 690.94 TaxID=1392251 RepID=A0A9P4UJ93_9PLEO|nr:WD40 repeat-like protein [Karstenula rhodostoma CBS 690.94]
MPVPVHVDRQQPAQDAARPSYIFRGHAAHIHSVELLRRNTCLLTGDADGWLVCWKLDTKRPLAVWKAHDAAILATAEWGLEKVITHGRDNTLRIWQLRGGAASYSTVLPADGADTHRPKPWLLHTLPVNTLNFCAFAMCYQRGRVASPNAASDESIYVAVPGRDDKKADVYQFPDEKLICPVPSINNSETGMVMALKLVLHQPSNAILVIAGYEAGITAVHLVPRNRTGPQEPVLALAQTIYLSQPHTQPVLSIDALPDGSTYFSSSADAIIAAHRIPHLPRDHVEPTSLQKPVSSAEDPNEGEKANMNELTEHDRAANFSGATSGAAETLSKSSQPVDSDTEPTEPLAFPKTRQTTNSRPASDTTNPAGRTSGLSALLASAPPQQNLAPIPRQPPLVTIQPAHKTVSTKHAGQQSLRVRSDGRVLVTGGWDSRVRVYSTKTLREVAVLKWHQVGVYAVDFGEVLGREDVGKPAGEHKAVGDGAEAVKRETGLAKLQRQREEAVQMKHWVAAGAKDGRVSLWEVF